MTDVEIEPTTNGAPKVVSERAQHDLDVIVIGSGPGGQRAAIQAAKLGKRVAVVERRERVGGVSIHTGTVPSKTLRQAILEDIANRGKDVPDPLHPELRERAAVEYLRDRTARVVAQETAIIREQFRRNSVGLIIGDAEFLDQHTIRITDDIATTPDQIVTADHVVLAVGTRPARPQGVDFDERRVIDSDGILRLEEAVPRTMTVVGGRGHRRGVRLDVRRHGHARDARRRPATLLPFIDREIAIALRYLLRRRNVSFRFGEEVVGVDREDGRVLTRLKSGKTIQSHTLMYATGRQGATEHLKLERAGLTCDKRGRIEVDDDYRTAVPHIFAVGDVAGPPGLAATSMEQGRIAALRAYGQPVSRCPSSSRSASTRSRRSPTSARPRRS